MDLNYLYYRQQESLLRAASASNEPARLAHSALASLYGRRIADMQGRREIPQAA